MPGYFYSLARDEKKGLPACFFKAILLLLSFIYGFIVALTRAVYSLGIIKKVELESSVISVGNITCGGTGKTPFVRMLVKYLSHKGDKTAILIRGYKRGRAHKAQAGGSARTMGDEGYLLSKITHAPVLVGRDRIKTGRKAQLEYNPDVIILDDGFQHWRLRRDLDIVLINAVTPFGNNHLIPRGILRERISNLKRADVFALSKVNLADDTIALKNKLKSINPQALIIETVHKPVCFSDLSGRQFKLQEIANKEVCIFSAIADFSSFESTVSGLGGAIKRKFEFPDHYSYKQEDLDEILSDCKEAGISIVVTTQKDAVKLTTLRSDSFLRLLILNIELKIIKNEQEFQSRLHSV